MKKMCHHMTAEWLAEVCEDGDHMRPSFPAHISEVLAITLENEVNPLLLIMESCGLHTCTVHALKLLL